MSRRVLTWSVPKKILPGLFAKLPDELNAKYSALRAIREAFESAYHSHSEGNTADGEASDAKRYEP